ncbi:hypothetical protein RSSM_01797 [Rhodopirellula sallentina SM41]|uniref:Uncharacterized protein n=1 Tax=Rhodopirellula sallentina SM41 TaxID=1263870 RepID=M5U5N1_9BACT|nr:hypothetical protein RSSM_01797 [Rhodopirellula sallentina SM41]
MLRNIAMPDGIQRRVSGNFERIIHAGSSLANLVNLRETRGDRPKDWIIVKSTRVDIVIEENAK